jgi:hypothetical protein
MPALTEIQQLNRELGDKVLADAKQNPHAYPGKYVGIANGHVVVVTDDLNELVRRVHAVEPDPANTFGIEIGRDYEKVYEIWGLHGGLRSTIISAPAATAGITHVHYNYHTAVKPRLGRQIN